MPDVLPDPEFDIYERMWDYLFRNGTLTHPYVHPDDIAHHENQHFR